MGLWQMQIHGKEIKNVKTFNPKNENDLVELVCADISNYSNSIRPNIIIQAGHFPLSYDSKNAFEDIYK